MTDEKTTDLILEHLKRCQAQLTRVEERMHNIQNDMRAIKQHMSAFMTSEANQDTEVASVKLQLERIERRLELRDSLYDD